MRYSINAKDRIFLKGYGYLSFAKTWVHMQLNLLKI